MEACPACRQAAIPAWRRWLSKEKFQCPSCAVWLVLRRSRRQPGLGNYPNVMLFVVYPLLMMGGAVTIGLIGGLIAGSNRALFFVAASIMLLAFVWRGLRNTWRSKYEICETQRHVTQWQSMREAWKLPEFRVAAARLLLFFVEVFVIAALIPPFVRYVRNAL
jgi:hypothetical protein